MVRRHRGGYGILPPARGRPGRGEAAADPAPTEAKAVAGVLVIDLDLMAELAGRRRPELAADRRRPTADPVDASLGQFLPTAYCLLGCFGRENRILLRPPDPRVW